MLVGKRLPDKAAPGSVGPAERSSRRHQAAMAQAKTLIDQAQTNEAEKKKVADDFSKVQSQILAMQSQWFWHLLLLKRSSSLSRSQLHPKEEETFSLRAPVQSGVAEVYLVLATIWPQAAATRTTSLQRRIWEKSLLKQPQSRRPRSQPIRARLTPTLIILQHHEHQRPRSVTSEAEKELEKVVVEAKKEVKEVQKTEAHGSKEPGDLLAKQAARNKLQTLIPDNAAALGISKASAESLFEALASSSKSDTGDVAEWAAKHANFNFTKFLPVLGSAQASQTAFKLIRKAFGKE